jgi:glycosyltransferase involved in cell wall biosynthesis
MNQAMLIRKCAVEMGFEVEMINSTESMKFPKERYDKGIAFVPLWARYIYDVARLLAPWFSRTSVLYGPVDGPYKTNLNLFGVINNFRLVVPSQFCKDCLDRNNIHVLDVVPHGIDHSDFMFEDIPKYSRLKRLREKYPNRKILFSNLNPLHRKGLVHLAKALGILNKKIGGDYIFILHTGLKQAQEVVTKLAPSEKIDLTKIPNLVIEDQYAKLPFRAIAEKMTACDVYVHPSLNEGFGEPILEAAAAKRTIVCLDAGAMNEIVSEKEAWLYPMTEVREEVWDNGAIAQLHEYMPQALADAMQYAIEDEKASEEKAEKAFQRSLEFDYKKVYKKLLAY